ncbi:hypothetical protein DXG01_016519 [Tephrocybe rancida]|nr:hypothetical protein DXG01_016519 [Tephrocybe rancida]
MALQTAVGDEPKPMDIDDTNTNSPTTAPPQPLFDFPKEQPRTFTAKDLIAILSLHNSDFKKDGKSGKSKLPTKEEAFASEALKILNGKGSRQRMVHRHWPRSPTGKYITPENTLPGKCTPNGIQLWGSSIFDFYRVRRMPDVANLSTITTGSKLMKWMKAHGELDHAKDEIEWAEMEEEPKLIASWSPREKIEEMEEDIRQGKAGKLPTMKAAKGEQPLPADAGANYFSSWPLVPFSYTTERLTSSIDLDHLPKKLSVHDPWNLLAAGSSNEYGRAERHNGQEWESRIDRTHIYKLVFSNNALERAKRQAEERTKFKEKEARLNKILNSPGSVDASNTSAGEGYLLRPPAVPGPVAPPIFVVHGPPPYPPTPTSKIIEPIEEAHLYLSPAHPIGTGNHSVVYQGEWELPRAVVVPPPSTDYVLCETCVAEDVARILRDQDGEDGERMDPKWKVRSGEVKIVPEGRPSVVFHVVQVENLDKPDAEEGQYQTEDTTYRVEFTGPVRPIRTTVAWQDPKHPTCKHVTPPPDVPPTVKVRVVSKISLQGDGHLVKEAANYETFERHMFEHWSGFNVLPPMHDPVPVGALVPQFYGYYIPEERFVEEQEQYEAGGEKDEEDVDMGEDDSEAAPAQSSMPQGYLSPILLLEDCGSVVDPDELTHDQKNEALSLIYRFHYAGWAHGSVYARNILVQPGPISASPSERSKDIPSFRLIDFGRSYRCDAEGSNRASWTGDRYHEESSMEKLFGMSMF